MIKTAFMRAKMEVIVTERAGETIEHVVMRAVAASQYPQDGSDENNSYARFTPQADLRLLIANPDLLGQIKEGDVFYADFTLAERRSEGDGADEAKEDAPASE